MVKISPDDKTLTPSQLVPLPPDILEARLEDYLVNSFDTFCNEIGQNDLQFVGRQVSPSSVVRDKIDMLAIDRAGRTVIIELKTGGDKLQLLQAIGYAGMVSMWDEDAFTKKAGDKLSDVEDFLQESELTLGEANQAQRIVLVAEKYDYEVLAGAKWLHEAYGVDITCLRVEVFLEGTETAGKSKYLTFAQIYPNKELDDLANGRGSKIGPSGEGTAAPEFLKVIDMYNASAPQGMRAEGMGRNFRVIHPAGWPFRKFLLYGFIWKVGGWKIQLIITKCPRKNN